MQKDDVVVRVENLSKKFCPSLKRSMYYGTVDSAKGMIGMSSDSSVLRQGEFWALKDINFELRRGEALGLIGANGCGKSTLLRLLSGIFPPDAGRIEARGRLGSLIAVGAGFHPHMSGRENIFLNGTLLGMSRLEIVKKFDEIVDFAEIGDFLEVPVSTYSSGMRVKLGFAIAVQIEPDILLVDEVMSVGDTRFRRKASEAMSNLLENSSSTLILVSHNAFTVKQQCDTALLMDHGKEVFCGDVEEAYERYQQINSSSGNGEGNIKNSDFSYFRIVSEVGERLVQDGKPFIIEFDVKEELLCQRDLPVKLTVFDADNSPVLSMVPASLHIKSTSKVRLQGAPLNLKNGTYTMQCKLGTAYQGTSVLNGYQFEVQGNPRQANTAVCVDLRQV